MYMHNKNLISNVRRFSIFLDLAALVFSLYLAGYIMWWGDVHPDMGFGLVFLVLYLPIWFIHAAIYGVLLLMKKRIRTRILLIVSLALWLPLFGSLHDPLANLFKSLGINS